MILTFYPQNIEPALRTCVEQETISLEPPSACLSLANGTVENVGPFSIKSLKFQTRARLPVSQSYHVLAAWPWASSLTSMPSLPLMQNEDTYNAFLCQSASRKETPKHTGNFKQRFSVEGNYTNVGRLPEQKWASKQQELQEVSTIPGARGTPGT